MAIKIDSNMAAVAYHVIDGRTDFPYAIDAHSAVSRFPGEWSFAPWSAADAAVARETLTERYARETEEAKAKGLPPPAPLPEPVQPTPEEQAAIDDHAKAVAEANERLKAFRADQAEKQKIADQVAADEALVASAPPTPDPTIRRPTAKEKRAEFLKLTPEEQAEADRRIGLAAVPAPAEIAKKAADDKIVADKAAADAQSGVKVSQ